MFAQPSRGRAWRGCPKPRRRSWLRKQSAQALQTAIKTRVVSTGRRGGPSGTTSASGETPERRLWAWKREDRRLRGAQRGIAAESLIPADDWEAHSGERQVDGRADKQRAVGAQCSRADRSLERV